MRLKNNARKRWIAIDGGGTKTSCVIGDEQGNILSKTIGTSSNIQTIPHQKVFTTLTHLIDKVLIDSGSEFKQVESIQLCLAGADRESDKQIIKRLFEDTIYEQKLQIKNDAEAALASGTWGESGLLLIAGTGSIVYGVSYKPAKMIRVGGWGYLLGDEGSGFYIGLKGLKAVLKSYDNRGDSTTLTSLILNHFQLQQVPELVRLYSEESVVPNIANLSKYVFEAAKLEDPVATGILEDAVHELIRMVEVGQNKFENNNCLLVLHGGLFSDSYFKELFIRKLNSVHEDHKVVYPEIPAVVGAYLLAIKGAGLLIDENFKKKVRLSWSKLEQQN
ncbi:BadF/BadG/BcrA/BcrD ATPase family protein [Cytobacillus sp. FJAT-54145]|uniref:BadF/BadG/BcrA/BcrD ATPase family protein n=1 Tax=Cytobacillus spartinae TaxID=3299023 RepID=A0ABW6KBF9_9BACI